MEGVGIDFREDGCSQLQKPWKEKLVLRARSILESVLLDTMYDILSNWCLKVVIDSSVINEDSKLLIVYEEAKTGSRKLNFYSISFEAGLYFF